MARTDEVVCQWLTHVLISNHLLWRIDAVQRREKIHTKFFIGNVLNIIIVSTLEDVLDPNLVEKSIKLLYII